MLDSCLFRHPVCGRAHRRHRTAVQMGAHPGRSFPDFRRTTLMRKEDGCEDCHCRCFRKECCAVRRGSIDGNGPVAASSAGGLLCEDSIGKVGAADTQVGEFGIGECIFLNVTPGIQRYNSLFCISSAIITNPHSDFIMFSNLVLLIG